MGRFRTIIEGWIGTCLMTWLYRDQGSVAGIKCIYSRFQGNNSTRRKSEPKDIYVECRQNTHCNNSISLPRAAKTQYVPPARLFFLLFVVTGGATLFTGIAGSMSSPGLPPLTRIRPSLSFSRTTGEAAGLYLNSGEYLIERVWIRRMNADRIKERKESDIRRHRVNEGATFVPTSKHERPPFRF